MIAEDDELMRQVYATTFKGSGFEVAEAADGMEALDKAGSFAPDVMLLDIMLPKLSGLEVLDKIKADPKLEKIIVVGLTNLTGDDVTSDILARGASLCIIKDQFRPKEIVDKIKELLENS